MTKILVVENHADMREILVKILDLMGFTAITSKNGREGVEKALAEKPDLIVMDIMMPEISGWEATRILRSNPETKDVPSWRQRCYSGHPIFRDALAWAVTTISSSHLR
jgi:CheY-like chemotaxis protein